MFTYLYQLIFGESCDNEKIIQLLKDNTDISITTTINNTPVIIMYLYENVYLKIDYTDYLLTREMFIEKFMLENKCFGLEITHYDDDFHIQIMTYIDNYNKYRQINDYYQ